MASLKSAHSSGKLLYNFQSRFGRLSIQNLKDNITDELFCCIIVYTPEKYFIFAMTPNPEIYIWQ
jgi:hypothetical protein